MLFCTVWIPGPFAPGSQISIPHAKCGYKPVLVKSQKYDRVAVMYKEIQK
jgi:hypothetical protein